MKCKKGLDELNGSFRHDHSAPALEPLSLPMSTAPEDFINEINVTKTFQPLKLKSSSGQDGDEGLEKPHIEIITVSEWCAGGIGG